MSNEFKHLSFTQHVVRVLFAIGATVLVAVFSYAAIRWIFVP
jgi:hypothetical protein